MIISITANTPPLPPSPLIKPSNLRKLWSQRISTRRRRGICRSDLASDAPFVAAIGASIFTSLVFPVSFAGDTDEENGGGGIESTDARFAVMGIIGFIPYFNWMSWVFAWMDTGKQRYLVYAVVYLAPYFRTNLSLSPDESWLPIASILLCLLHIQLEVSITNGDLDGLPFLSETMALFSSIRKEDTQFQRHQGSTKGKSKKQIELPNAQNRRDELKNWGIPKNHDTDLHHHSKETPNVNEEETKSDKIIREICRWRDCMWFSTGGCYVTNLHTFLVMSVYCSLSISLGYALWLS